MHNRRFIYTTSYPDRDTVVQDLTITDLQTDDSGLFFCNVYRPATPYYYMCIERSRVEDSSRVVLSVKVSPPSYPVCSPSGPITVDTETELPMRCLSETRNPAVIAGTHPITDPSSYPWTSSSVDGTVTLSLNLTVTVVDDGVAFLCSVTNGTGGSDTVTRPCIIGPINVTISGVEDATNEITSIEPETTPTTFNICQPPPCSQWIVAFVVTSVLFSVSIIVIIRCAFQIFKMRRLIKSLTRTEASQIPKADPYMELQPTEDKNRVYMEPTTATTTTQDTHYEPVEVKTDSPEYDYARPEGSTNTSYKAVGKPQSSVENPYQNMNN